MREQGVEDVARAPDPPAFTADQHPLGSDPEGQHLRPPRTHPESDSAFISGCSILTGHFYVSLEGVLIENLGRPAR